MLLLLLLLLSMFYQCQSLMTFVQMLRVIHLLLAIMLFVIMPATMTNASKCWLSAGSELNNNNIAISRLVLDGSIATFHAVTMCLNQQTCSTIPTSLHHT